MGARPDTADLVPLGPFDFTNLGDLRSVVGKIKDEVVVGE